MKYILVVFFLLGSFLTMAQQTDVVDFKSIGVKLEIEPELKRVSGKVNCIFDILKKSDSIYLDARTMTFDSITLNDKRVNTYNDGEKLWIIGDFKPSKKNELFLEYEATPKKTMYFIGWENEGQNQVWTQGQGKYTSHWLPSIDDMNDKIEFDLSVTFDNDYEVIANGKLKEKNIGKEATTWHYDMKQPMSSYLVALAIGKYDKKNEISKSGIPLEMYYYPEDSAKVEPTYRYTKTMFDFLEEEIGVSYPWQNYKQVPVRDFLYAGMENTSTTIFSDAFVVDSIAFVDKNYVNVNAHELAHQWFGDLVTEESGTHHWLQEGFATFYALLAERHVFGEDYYYWRLYEYAQELLAQDEAGGSTALLDPKSSSATFYKKGALVLHMLKKKVGNKAFNKAVKNYLKKYKYKNVETEDFINAVEEASGKKMTAFVQRWLRDKDFHYKEVESHLVGDSNLIEGHLQIDCEAYTSRCEDYLTSWIADESKIKVVGQMPNRIKAEDFKNSIKVRQAIAQNLTKVPLELKEEYESLLSDKSYLTVESALFNLINSFPSDTKKYMDLTKDVIGFNDRNIRQLWLFMALVTNVYPEESEAFFKELTGYTDPKYHFEVREQAFQFLKGVRACNEECTKNLEDAAKHHNWRFKKKARELLEQKQ